VAPEIRAQREGDDGIGDCSADWPGPLCRRRPWDGAQQSHVAIVARELGIPAIVGDADATTRLIDGQTIEIDGATGLITVK
jgi:hypothetical protein